MIYKKLAILFSTLELPYYCAAEKINLVLKVKLHLLWKYIVKASFFLFLIGHKINFKCKYTGTKT